MTGTIRRGTAVFRGPPMQIPKERLPSFWDTPEGQGIVMSAVLTAYIKMPDDDLALSFDPGCVAPDGTIWLTETSRAERGVCEIVEVEAAKAERFGWQRISGLVGGKVRVQRK